MEFLSDIGTRLKQLASKEKITPFDLLALTQKLGEIEVKYLTRLTELGDDEARAELIKRHGTTFLSVKTPSVGSLLDAAEMALAIYEFNEDTLNGDEQDAYEALDREVRKFRPDYDDPDA